MKTRVKMEIACESSKPPENDCFPKARQAFIELSSSGDDYDNSGDESNNETSGGGFGRGPSKRRRLDDLGVVLPVGFLEPLHPHDKQEEVRLLPPPESDVDGHDSASGLCVSARGSNSKQFWKAGEYEGAQCGEWDLASGTFSVGMDHVRVHPKFLHSNATSHKWALGAFAELLDNSLDEVCNGATYVNVDMLLNKKDGSRMLLIEDNGGGMDPDKMRHCMSLGYSAKSKQANTIGQYGNGFKTSTMRLGADVIVFSRCHGRDGKSSSQSIGLLSYTFLRSTGKEDIVVPMVDYMRGGGEWKKIIRSSAADWAKNMETIVQWSPFNSEAELLRQFRMMKDHGTRVIIYNLWEDDQGLLELDFDADFHDIQIRGVNRDEKNIQMAQQFPNSRHFLTYRHSLRSYASILYLRLPPGFRIILRGKDVEHHNIVNDMMMSQEITYRPQTGPNAAIKETNMVAVVTIGFVKDAKYHIDVQGFNVYHKNRLIKPFWRLWNAAGSDGRGVIGVLEANFVEPAHDKQGFERTTVLARLEARLIQMQKAYWSSRCHKIGYAPRSKKSIKESQDGGLSPKYLPATPSFSGKKDFSSNGKGDKFSSHSNKKYGIKGYQLLTNDTKPRKSFSPESSSPSTQVSDMILEKQMNVENVESLNLLSKNYCARDSLSLTRSASYLKDIGNQHETFGNTDAQTTTQVSSKDGGESSSNFEHALVKLKEENHELKERLERNEEIVVGELQKDLQDEREKCRSLEVKDGGESSTNFEHALVKLKEENRELKKRLERNEEIVVGELQKDLQDEKEKCRSLEAKLLVAEGKIEELNKEQNSLIDIFAEERERRDEEERNLRNKLQDASNTIRELLDKVKLMGKMKALK